MNGKKHRIDGPAVEYGSGRKEWWVNDVETNFPDVCEKTISSNLLYEEFYKLCLHEDYVVRQLATHNPQRPVEWRILAGIIHK